VGVFRAYEIATVLAQDFHDIGVGIPSQTTPYDLVYVVITAFGIRDEADRIGLVYSEDRRHLRGTRVDDLAGLSQRVSRIPVGHGELAVPAVRNVRVMAYRDL